VHSGASEALNIDALFFIIVWDRYEFHKKHTGTRYAELVCFYPEQSVGHLLHSGVSGAQNVDAIFFMHECTRCGFHPKHVGTCYTEIVVCIWWDLWVT
jgi:hypothetical protein